MIRARVVLDTASVRVLHDSQQGLERCFTDAEIAQLPSRFDPVPSLAARLAAKVATAGMLKRRTDGCAQSGSVVEFHAPSRERAAELRDVEVLLEPDGAPRLVLGSLAFPGSKPGWVSLSHDAGLAAALVVLNC